MFEGLLNDERVPAVMKERLVGMGDDLHQICTAANQQFVTPLPERISYRIKGSSLATWGNRRLIPPDEEAQAISFVIRYEHLPNDVRVFVAPVEDEWHISNLWALKSVLNDYRPIIQN